MDMLHAIGEIGPAGADGDGVVIKAGRGLGQ
jgi:hypothetical protein